MLETLSSYLSELCAGLNRKGLNYTVSLGFFPALGTAGDPIPGIVRSAVGEHAVMGGQPAVSTLDELLAEFESCIQFKGGAGSHPSPGFLASPECARLLEAASARLREEFANSDSIYALWFSAGHPYYPVFWDFAFLIERPPDSFLFIGSSSD